ncbi:MAG: TMEM175 family protein [Mucilaginibacter sp.]|uniref:TMEM175 family protein n=1 Tax=Mucilaginibacter sp. TaxID=1882438 RepID=UPI00326507D8
MHKARLEAFSDGVIAIIITIMVLEMKVPHGHTFAELWDLRWVFLSYVLSFIYVGIYWNNHHHMLQATHSINGGILWANLHLLFWLSLVPFASGWMGENHFTALPVALYGVVMLMNSIAYTILAYKLVKHNGKDSLLAKAFGPDWKGKVSMAIYAVAVAVSWLCPWVSFGLYVVVACIWFIPDSRIEDKIGTI